jgi:general secretion pathway protein C
MALIRVLPAWRARPDEHSRIARRNRENARIFWLARPSQCGFGMMQIDRLLERYSGPFLLSWLMLISYLHAWGIARLTEAVIAGDAPNRSRYKKPRTQIRSRPTAEAIIRRNPFDSVTGPLNRAPVPRLVPGYVDPLSAPECETTRVVIVTEAREPTRSVATLRGPAASGPRDFRVGDHLAGQTVAFIGFNPAQQSPSVWLSGAAGLCQTSLFGARTEQPRPASAVPVPAPSDSPARGWLSHVRVVPEQKDGSLVGIRLFGIRSDSLLRLVGLQNGDRLESINGFALGTPAQALTAYVQLRTANRVALNIERQGRPLTLAYRIN